MILAKKTGFKRMVSRPLAYIMLTIFDHGVVKNDNIINIAAEAMSHDVCSK
jgi:hypothetical protein